MGWLVSKMEGLVFCTYEVVNLDALSFTTKTHNHAYTEMLKIRQELPAFQAQQRVMEAIHSSQVVIVSGATGESTLSTLPVLPAQPASPPSFAKTLFSNNV